MTIMADNCGISHLKKTFLKNHFRKAMTYATKATSLTLQLTKQTYSTGNTSLSLPKNSRVRSPWYSINYSRRALYLTTGDMQMWQQSTRRVQDKTQLTTDQCLLPAYDVSLYSTILPVIPWKIWTISKHSIQFKRYSTDQLKYSTLYQHLYLRFPLWLFPRGVVLPVFLMETPSCSSYDGTHMKSFRNLSE